MDAIFDHGPGPNCPDRFNMAAHALRHADRLNTKTALIVLDPDGPDMWTYGRLKQAVLGTATGLLNSGLAPGERLLMRLGNTVDFPIVYLAAIAVGIIPVPTSSQLTVPEVGKIHDELNPGGVVAATGVALPEHPNCPVITTDDLRQMQSLPPADVVMGDPNRPAYIIFTSGTAGRARGVVHAHRAIWARQMMWQDWYGLTPDDRLLHAGAFNWTYTLGTGLMDPWAIGATALIPGAGLGPGDLAGLLAQNDATIFAAAPGVYRQILKTPMPPLPALRHGLSAGEKLPDATRAAWQSATNTGIYEAFGMSECSTFVSASPTHPAPPTSLGFAQTGRRVAILNDGDIAKTNEPGIIAVARTDPGLMLGYLDDDAGTQEKFQGDWFLTGDTGEMDENGAITYLGRDDDMMNAGGYRVSPIEVESAMRHHPDIIDCAVVETSVRQDVRVIAAFYTSSSPIKATALSAHAAAHLARYKQPRIFHHIARLPSGANGKILRKKLRAMNVGNS